MVDRIGNSRRQMVAPSSSEVTKYLQAWNQGDEAALEKLMPIVYNELRKLARSYMRRERSGHTLQATALVHEAFLRLIDQNAVTWQNRAHFFGIAAQMMKRILVNHEVSRRAAKRSGGAEKVTLEQAKGIESQQDLDIIQLNEALQELESMDSRQCRIVELRFFSGLTLEETAEVMNLSLATVKRDWSTAKLWLRQRISKGTGS
ncbi:sigma-70 family RNA polymerase sigma factor [bacterium]|nr:sigma-70 family RNA polymerase sigma factor [bacterium]